MLDEGEIQQINSAGHNVAKPPILDETASLDDDANSGGGNQCWTIKRKSFDGKFFFYSNFKIQAFVLLCATNFRNLTMEAGRDDAIPEETAIRIKNPN